MIGGNQGQWVWRAVPIATVELHISLLTFATLVLAVRHGYAESWLLLTSLASGYLFSSNLSCREIWHLVVQCRKE